MTATPPPKTEPWLEVACSRHFAGWMTELKVSLAFTTYQAGKLFLVGLKASGQVAVFERTFSRCMGLWGDGQTLWLSTQFQLWRLENTLDPGERYQDGDRLYTPRVGYITGDLDIHDIAVESDGRVVFANTLFNCLATVSERRNFIPLWRPPFISRLAAEDRCHLNGLALLDGRAKYVTVVSRTDVVDGWRDRRANGGCVIDVTTNETVCANLSMPHSPRLHEGKLYLHNSGTGYFGTVNLASGTFEPIAFCPGYLRGLAFAGRYAIVGLSKPRDKTFTGLALQDALGAQDVEAWCGLHIIDLKSGDVAHWARLQGMVSELYDVITLPNVVRPVALGFQSDEIQRTFAIDKAGQL